MFAPLNVGSRNVWPSAKSRAQPTFGQTATAAVGKPQKRVITTCWESRRSLTLKPTDSNAALASSEIARPLPSTGPTIRIGSPS